MQLRREVALGLGSVLALQILLALLAIVVLSRMRPVIELILQENVRSEVAVETMLAALAKGEETTEQDRRVFADALEFARDNATEEAETPLLEAIEQDAADALGGDRAARARVILSLQALGQVNRDSMERTDAEAQRLAIAGAWATVVLGGTSFGLGLLVYRRLRLRLELPIAALRQTTHGMRTGNIQARCAMIDGPQELKDIANDLNWLFDQWLHERRGRGQTSPQPSRDADVQRSLELRRVLVRLLDAQSTPTAVVSKDGRPVALSTSAMDLTLPCQGGEADAWETEEIEGTSMKLLCLRADER